ALNAVVRYAKPENESAVRSVVLLDSYPLGLQIPDIAGGRLRQSLCSCENPNTPKNESAGYVDKGRVRTSFDTRLLRRYQSEERMGGLRNQRRLQI
uniref:Movement protein n=1 Tax=Macrostomum lignano TaxID=282301 RepID=A0A1I8HC15_9PLAT